MALPTTSRGRRAATGCAALLVVLTGCGDSPETAGAEASRPAVATESPSSAPATTTKPAVPDREPHTLVLNATGTASVTSIRYVLDGRPVQEGAVRLPWRRSLNVPADGLPHSWSLSIQFTGAASASVDLVAIYDGKVTARGRSGGSGTGNTTVSGGGEIGGNVRG